MKNNMSITTLIVLLSALFCPVVSYSLLRRGASAKADPAVQFSGGVSTGASSSVAAPAPAVAKFTGDPALAIVSGTGGDDYYTKAWTGENAGDTLRGAGGCTAFRRTLQCNPSGPRDPKQDKGCQQVVDAHESGFCECGGYAQFAAVDCKHRPFTCEVMCVKFAVVTGKNAIYRNQVYTPAQAKPLLDRVMWGNQTDMEAMRMKSKELEDYMTRALQYTSDTGDQAKASMAKFLDMMKIAREKDAAQAAGEMDRYRQMIKDKPWLKIYENGGKLIAAGQGIQAKVRQVLPFDPLTAPERDTSGLI